MLREPATKVSAQVTIGALFSPAVKACLLGQPSEGLKT